MRIDEFREYCLSFPKTSEGTPFNGFFHNARSILVMYVLDKMFCFFDIDKFDACTIKCDPDRIDSLKDAYGAVSEPFNLSPRHWISIRFNGDVPDKLLKQLVKESYHLVVKGMSKKDRQDINTSFNAGTAGY